MIGLKNGRPQAAQMLMLQIWIFLNDLSSFNLVDAAPCTPCPNPNDSYAASLLEKPVTLPEIGQVTCGATATLLPFMDETEPDCAAVQSMGTYCGCPVRQENPCSFLMCESFNGEQTVNDFMDYSGYTANCNLVSSLLESMAEGSDQCLAARGAYSEICGCRTEAPPEGNDDEEHDDDDDDNDDSGEEEELVGWTLCPDGSPATRPERDLISFSGRSDNEIVQQLAPLAQNGTFTCGWMEFLTSTGIIPVHYQDDLILKFVAGLCGCPPPNGEGCEVCPQHDMNRTQPYHMAIVEHGIELTCGELEDAVWIYSKTEYTCWTALDQVWQCGCNGGTPYYLGADSSRQHKVLAWTPRISGFFSFLGSFYIIQDIWRKRRHGFSAYQLIMLGMSMFDISSSTAWMVSTAALPAYDNLRDSEYMVYGAKGNDQSCTAQGFFLQLGFVGSTSFTASLTTFYLLTIVYGYRESRIRSFRKFFVGIPSFLAVVLACAAIPYYRPFYVACLVSNPNTETEVSEYAHEWRYLIIFSILPIGISILITVGNLLVILRFVVKQNQRADQWRFSLLSRHPRNIGSNSNGNNNNQQTESSSKFSLRKMVSSMKFGMSRSNGVGVVSTSSRRRNMTEMAVFWQAFWYVMAFLLTWVIYLVGQFKPYFSTNDDKLYAFWITMLVLNPLMGFWNAFVYVKPWTWSLCKCQTRLLNRKSASETSHNTKSMEQDSQQNNVQHKPDSDLQQSEKPEETSHSPGENYTLVITPGISQEKEAKDAGVVEKEQVPPDDEAERETITVTFIGEAGLASEEERLVWPGEREEGNALGEGNGEDVDKNEGSLD